MATSTYLFRRDGQLSIYLGGDGHISTYLRNDSHLSTYLGKDGHPSMEESIYLSICLSIKGEMATHLPIQEEMAPSIHLFRRGCPFTYLF